jgi:hypothetical protein
VARVPDLRQIKKEDFDSKDQRLIEKLAFPINNFMQQVINVLKNGVDFNNLNQQVVTFTLSVDSTGKPVVPVQFQSSLNTKIQGLLCINAVNQSSTIRYPTALPLLSFGLNGNTVSITNVAGLGIPAGQTNSDRYTLTVLVIGTNIATS